MVKGVNKTVIEVNNTGSKLFEKIVLYVTPEYGNLSSKQLKKAARNFSFNFEDLGYPSLRKRVNKKKRIRVAVLIGIAAIVLTFAIVILCK